MCYKALCNHPSVSSSFLKQLNSYRIEADQGHRFHRQHQEWAGAAECLFCPCAEGVGCCNGFLLSTCFILLSLKTLVLEGIDSKVQNKHQSDSDSDSALVSHRSLLKYFLLNLPTGWQQQNTSMYFSFLVWISSGTVQVRAYSPGFHVTFSLLNLLLLASVHLGEAQLGLLFPLLTVSKNAYCCTRSSKSWGAESASWVGDVPKYLVWDRLQQQPAQLAEHQSELYLQREPILSMSVSLPIFIRVYQQQLKRAGIYCQIAWTNNLISHCLKNDPHLSRLCN